MYDIRSRFAVAAFTVGSVVGGALLVGGSIPPTTGVVAAGAESSVDGNERRDDLTTMTSAIPTEATPSVHESAQDEVRVTRDTRKAEASAIATSDCDGCDAQSTTFQIVEIRGRGTGPAAADNSAVAWSSCIGCSSSAVSVQVVLAQRVEQLTVNNRALALNVACEACVTTAVSMQFVIAADKRRDISSEAEDLIAQIEAELAARLAQPAPSADSRAAAPSPEALADEAASSVEEILTEEIGSAAVQRSVAVHVAE